MTGHQNGSDPRRLHRFLDIVREMADDAIAHQFCGELHIKVTVHGGVVFAVWARTQPFEAGPDIAESAR